MKTYLEIKENRQKETEEIIKRNAVFFAFSDKQLDEGRGELGYKDLVRLEGGGFLPKKNLNKFMEEFDKLEEKTLEEIKKIDPEEGILYELRNHEAFYSGNITDAYEVLKHYGITFNQIYKVYEKYQDQERKDKW